MAFLIFFFSLFVAGVLKYGLFIVKRILKGKWLLLRRSSQGEFIESNPWKGKEPSVFSGKAADFSEWGFAMEEALAVVPQIDQVRFGCFVSSCRLSEMVYNNLLSLWTPLAERLVFFKFAKTVVSGFFSQVRESLSLHQTSKNTAGWDTLQNSEVSVFHLQEWTT